MTKIPKAAINNSKDAWIAIDIPALSGNCFKLVAMMLENMSPVAMQMTMIGSMTVVNESVRNIANIAASTVPIESTI